MALVRINAEGEMPRLRGATQPIDKTLARHDGPGPVIVMIHGCKYRPANPAHCPHRHILAVEPVEMPWLAPSWPRSLGFGAGHPDEGLGIAFGWDGRGPLWSARRNAVQAGRALARVLGSVHARTPQRPVHILAHSMGIEVVFAALHHLRPRSVGRIVAMTGAALRSRAIAALQTGAGATCEFFNVTSRENDLFDFLFETLVTNPLCTDVSIGKGLDVPNALNLQLDCTTTLAALHRLGAPVAPPQHRICHWSAYMRPGVLRFYNALLRQPGTWPMHALRQSLPSTPAPRWSRLVAPRAAATLAPATESVMIAP